MKSKAVTNSNFGYTPKITVVDELKNLIERLEIDSIIHRTPKVRVFGLDMFFIYDDEDFDIIIDRKYCDNKKDYIHRNIKAIALYYMTKAFNKTFKNSSISLKTKINICYGMYNENKAPYYAFPPNYCGNIEYAVASLKKQAALVYEELSKYVTVENNEYKGIAKFCIDMDISKGTVLFYKLIAENHIDPRLTMIEIESLRNHNKSMNDTPNTSFTIKNNNYVPKSPFSDNDPANRKQKRKNNKEKDPKLTTIVAKSMTTAEKYIALTNSGYFDFLKRAFGFNSREI